MKWGLNKITGTDEQTVQEIKNHILDLERQIDSGDGIVKKIQMNGSDAAETDGIVNLEIAVWKPIKLASLHWTYESADSMFVSTDLPAALYAKCVGTSQSRLTICREYVYHAYPLTNKSYIFGDYYRPQLNVKDTQYGSSVSDFVEGNKDTVIYYLE